MAHAVDAAADLDGLVDVADVVAIGPGLGQDAWGDELFSALIDNAKPLVVDADALNILATSPRKLQADTVLTPHPGEAARLLSIKTHEVQRSEEHTSELQSLMRISYAVFCLKKKKYNA